ncbi:Uracil permease [Lachnellula willkommii]|uniref:Uracil permease n=1 Tax=Lachnellula willkommii TaxID=215461 RepID=A0A559MGL3_9HELO|nr:Uracil permease [Lachnellula willkommii]
MPSFLRKVDDVLRTKESKFQDFQQSEKKWGNEDLDPSPPSARNWTHWNYFAFFWAVSFNPVAWNTGSSMIAAGLLWWQATVAAIVGMMIMATFLVLNSRGASIYHIGFPVYVRICAGFYSSMWFMFVRGIVAIFFFGTQTYYAGKLFEVTLRCIFGHAWTDIPNHLPKSAGITTSGITAFFLFWLLQLIFMFIHPSKSRWLYTFKSRENTSAVGWAFMQGINSVSGSLMTEVSSNPDLARYARTSAATTWPQWIGLVVAKSLCTFLGIGASSAVKTLWGTAYWNIWDLYTAILDHNYNAGTRTAVALACFIQAFAVIATNLAVNAVPVGSDLTGLFPRYFNIVRGQVLCAVLGLVICPWKLVNSAAAFITFLGSNVVFLSPLVSIMITDYFFIRKGNVHIPSLYKANLSSPYWYYGGFNLRTIVAWLVALLSVIHGLGGSFHKDWNVGSKHIYYIGMLMSFTIAGPLYYIFNLIWPVDIYPLEHINAPKTREIMAKTDGLFDDEVIIGYEEDAIIEENKAFDTKA